MAVGKMVVVFDVTVILENIETGEIVEVKDFYWFEENGFHNNGDNEWFIKMVKTEQL